MKDSYTCHVCSKPLDRTQRQFCSHKCKMAMQWNDRQFFDPKVFWAYVRDDLNAKLNKTLYNKGE